MVKPKLSVCEMSTRDVYTFGKNIDWVFSFSEVVYARAKFDVRSAEFEF